MTSINTNIAAQTALRTLQSTNMQLDATQGRISTGLKIGEAKDNAAYWSISTTLKSDNKALGTVKDALGLGAATVDTAYQGLNQTLDVLNEIKAKLTSAYGGSADRDAIQAEVSQLQSQLRAIADSSSFSGENWLAVDSSAAGYDASRSVVSSFTRDAGGNAKIDSISISLNGIALFDDSGSANGVIDQTRTGTSATLNYTSAVSTAATVTGTPLDLATESAQFYITNGGTTTLVEIDADTLDAAGFGATTTITTNNDLRTVLQQAFTDAGVSGMTVSVTDAGLVSFTSNGAFSIADASDSASGANLTALGLGNVAGTVTAPAAAVSGSVSTIDLGTLSATAATATAQIESYVKFVSDAINEVTSAAADLGAVAKRIELQQSFVNNLMDTIDKGVSGLIDADMNEESTRLQALQVKQQLGVQALSIANQSAQNVLSLFQ